MWQLGSNRVSNSFIHSGSVQKLTATNAELYLLVSYDVEDT
jgi:hypothetical protein